jgi:hypothetical protein
MSEHPVEQPIRSILTDNVEGSGAGYTVGEMGVTKIEACQKSGMYSNIPYVRVWAGETCLAEFCQHNIIGVYFGEPE